MMNITPTVKQLLIINIIFFIGSMLVPQTQVFLALYSPQSNHFGIWQLVTHMFMHGGFMHIFFNMFALYSFGSTLEHFWGGKKFLFFYFSCGLGAALVQLAANYYELQQILAPAADLNLSNETLRQILNTNFFDVTPNGTIARPDLFQNGIIPILEKAGKLNLLNSDNLSALYNAAISCQSPMVGASGVIYGLLVAFAFMFPNAELALMFIPIPIKAKYFVPIFMFIYDGFFGIFGRSVIGNAAGDGVAHFAHIGGAIVGFLMMWYWKKTQFDKNRWDR
jgi:membrane associated rhomboid family serine protease